MPIFSLTSSIIQYVCVCMCGERKLVSVGSTDTHTANIRMT